MALLTVPETAERWRVAPATVYRGCKAYRLRWESEGNSAYDPSAPLVGEVPCIQVGRVIRIPEVMLERMGV